MTIFRPPDGADRANPPSGGRNVPYNSPLASKSGYVREFFAGMSGGGFFLIIFFLLDFHEAHLAKKKHKIYIYFIMTTTSHFSVVLSSVQPV